MRPSDVHNLLHSKLHYTCISLVLLLTPNLHHAPSLPQCKNCLGSVLPAANCPAAKPATTVACPCTCCGCFEGGSTALRCATGSSSSAATKNNMQQPSWAAAAGNASSSSSSSSSSFQRVTIGSLVVGDRVVSGITAKGDPVCDTVYFTGQHGAPENKEATAAIRVVRLVVAAAGTKAETEIRVTSTHLIHIQRHGTTSTVTADKVHTGDEIKFILPPSGGGSPAWRQMQGTVKGRSLEETSVVYVKQKRRERERERDVEEKNRERERKRERGRERECEPTLCVCGHTC